MIKTKWVRVKHTLKYWLDEYKEYGFKVVSGNLLICFTKWYVGAKRIRLNYKTK